jgi:hypothetical protein
MQNVVNKLTNAINDGNIEHVYINYLKLKANKYSIRIEEIKNVEKKSSSQKNINLCHTFLADKFGKSICPAKLNYDLDEIMEKINKGDGNPSAYTNKSQIRNEDITSRGFCILEEVKEINIDEFSLFSNQNNEEIETKNIKASPASQNTKKLQDSISNKEQAIIDEPKNKFISPERNSNLSANSLNSFKSQEKDTPFFSAQKNTSKDSASPILKTIINKNEVVNVVKPAPFDVKEVQENIKSEQGQPKPIVQRIQRDIYVSKPSSDKIVAAQVKLSNVNQFKYTMSSNDIEKRDPKDLLRGEITIDLELFSPNKNTFINN